MQSFLFANLPSFCQQGTSLPCTVVNLPQTLLCEPLVLPIKVLASESLTFGVRPMFSHQILPKDLFSQFCLKVDRVFCCRLVFLKLINPINHVPRLVELGTLCKTASLVTYHLSGR